MCLRGKFYFTLYYFHMYRIVHISAFAPASYSSFHQTICYVLPSDIQHQLVGVSKILVRGPNLGLNKRSCAVQLRYEMNLVYRTIP
ncbi:hypothetical protein BDA96_09G049300 [Sorghum bicolor]|uniref:Uncharacterized protein n=2 Tax=Sorghum bicolor TaxID=4558 RepID=C5Z057_SORBI|nr:hypothetical protein SORBI_3009G046300 [Sorghum bicolor]KAG0516992.1 hypothetical protein BDA96_09G049300 [Sorghum bicolor]